MEIPDGGHQAATFSGTASVSAAILSFLIWIERDRPGARAVFPAMLAAISLVWMLWFALAPSAIWLRFARWFAALPLP